MIQPSEEVAHPMSQWPESMDAPSQEVRHGNEQGAVPGGAVDARILYGTHEQCEELVRAWRWPEGFACPRCSQTWHSEFRRGQRLYFQCSACRYQCSLVSGTVFESSKLPLPKWFLAMHLITQAKNSVSALELMRHLGVSYPTAWLVKHKLMEVTCEPSSRAWQESPARPGRAHFPPFVRLNHLADQATPCRPSRG
jgi:transposase-like protein